MSKFLGTAEGDDGFNVNEAHGEIPLEGQQRAGILSFADRVFCDA